MEKKEMTSDERVLLLLKCLEQAEKETNCKLVVIDDEMMIYDCIKHKLYEIDTSGIEVSRDE